jgi:hypothetical protein
MKRFVLIATCVSAGFIAGVLATVLLALWLSARLEENQSARPGTQPWTRRPQDEVERKYRDAARKAMPDEPKPAKEPNSEIKKLRDGGLR